MISKNFKAAMIGLAWIVGSAFVALLIWALAQGCVQTDELKGAVEGGLHKGISEGLANAGGIASDRLAEVLPQVVETAVRTAMEHVPKPRELPMGVEAALGFVAAVGWRAWDHWRKARRGARVETAIDDALASAPSPQVVGATNQESGT